MQPSIGAVPVHTPTTLQSLISRVVQDLPSVSLHGGARAWNETWGLTHLLGWLHSTAFDSAAEGLQVGILDSPDVPPVCPCCAYVN